MIDGVLLGGPLPRGTHLDVAGHSAQVRSLLVLERFGRKEARLDVERERLDGAAVGSIFGAGEGANLSPGDLLLLYPSPRPLAALMAIFERRTPARGCCVRPNGASRHARIRACTQLSRQSRS